MAQEARQLSVTVDVTIDKNGAQRAIQTVESVRREGEKLVHVFEKYRVVANQVAAMPFATKMKEMSGSLNQTTGAINDLNRGMKNTNFTFAQAFRRTVRIAAGMLILNNALMVLKTSMRTLVEFEDLEANLETLERSPAAGKKKFEELAKFGASTPFTVNKVVEGYSKLRGAGLKPTMKQMTAFGNIAAGMNRDIADMGRAIARGSSGAGEILRETFNIQFKKKGEKIFLAWGDTWKKTVKNNAADISAAIAELGDKEFSGAMTRRMATVGGAWSNAADNMMLFVRAVGQHGVSKALQRMATSITKMVGEGDNWAEVLGDKLASAINSVTDALEWLAKNGEDVRKTIMAIVFATALWKLNSMAISISNGALATTKLYEALGFVAKVLGVVATNGVRAGLALLFAEAGPLLFAVAAVAAFLVVTDLIGFLQGKESTVGRLFKALGIEAETAGTIVKGVLAVMAVGWAPIWIPVAAGIGLIYLLYQGFMHLGDAATWVSDTFMDAFRGVEKFFGGVFQSVKSVTDLFGLTKRAASSLGDASRNAIIGTGNYAGQFKEFNSRGSIKPSIFGGEAKPAAVDNVMNMARWNTGTAMSAAEFIGGGARGPAYDAAQQARVRKVRDDRERFTRREGDTLTFGDINITLTKEEIGDQKAAIRSMLMEGLQDWSQQMRDAKKNADGRIE